MEAKFNPFVNNFQLDKPFLQKQIFQNRSLRSIQRINKISSIFFVIDREIDFLCREYIFYEKTTVKK